MRSIDWRFLKRPLIVLVVSLLASAAIFVGSQEYMNQQELQYQQSLSSLRAMHSQYQGLVEDIALIDQYRGQYNDYIDSGLVGPERRLSWIESLESSNEDLKLPSLRYSLRPQTTYQRPRLNVPRDVVVMSSPMDLSLSLLHEGDLFVYLDTLQDSINTLFAIDSCTISRTDVNRPINTRESNLSSQCRLQWVMVDAQ